MALFTQRARTLLLGCLLSGAAIASPRAAIAQESVLPSFSSNHITTQGHGEVRVRPDSLRTLVGVEARAATLAAARREVNTKMHEVIRAIKALNLPGVTLETEALQFYPIYDKDQPPRIIGYQAANNVSVALMGATPSDLGDYASQIIDAAMKHGANRGGDVTFSLRDPSEARGRALALAVRDATRNAQAMAEAAGIRLIKIQSLEQGTGYRPSPAKRAMALTESEEAPTPIETGDIVVTASVTARFASCR